MLEDITLLLKPVKCLYCCVFVVNELFLSVILNYINPEAGHRQPFGIQPKMDPCGRGFVGGVQS